jgi:hypothetical protein
MRIVIVAVVTALAVVACSGDDDGSGATTTAGSQGSGPVDVEFLTGELPESLPGDFPIPAQGVIGSGMINRTAGTTELIIRIPALVPAATKFYEDNFEARDYEVTSSAAKGADGWVIGFAKDDLTGTVELSPIGVDLSQAVIRAET